jgi:hypothetical protein
MQVYHTVEGIGPLKFIMKLGDLGMDDLKAENRGKNEWVWQEKLKCTRLTYVVKKLSRVLHSSISSTIYNFFKKSLLDKPTESAPHGIKNLQFLFQSFFPTASPSDQNPLQNALGSSNLQQKYQDITITLYRSRLEDIR